MNNLDETPLMLLVRREGTESEQHLFALMQERYDARLKDADCGPKYKIGPAYVYQGQRFSKVCTFAGSLVMQVVSDTRQRKFDRAVIYRWDPDQCFRLLNPGGPESEIGANQLTEQISDGKNC